eukprot:CAMPEP_0181314152 /NCGR_PEP_ID=MMETSP1101-20121128/14655_1 /TAXON_ID=46948 /ORGANISM="Rhodomonas abbreviata, Strain Caron Lab Isolate" /LENGTH=195 /DNA_ID=CAMNT_0023421205 /DNA_START=39 /DNA_END=626 /DNA_ORIENTATION=+
MAGLGGFELEALSTMLQESSEKQDEAEEQQRVAAMGPGDIGPKKPAAPVKPEKKVDPNAIWDEDEVDEAHILNKVDKADKRARPKYDMRYRQKINTDDALGAPWSVQDNSSMSCREIVIKVDMPGTKFSTVKLDVTRKEFLVQAPKYLLPLSLSEDVDPDKGSAKWDSDKEQLEVVLPIVRGDMFAHYSMLDDPK